MKEFDNYDLDDAGCGVSAKQDKHGDVYVFLEGESIGHIPYNVMALAKSKWDRGALISVVWGCAARAHEQGFEEGRRSKAREIREALAIGAAE